MKPYCCNDDKDAYEQYYLNQSGDGGMPVFYGAHMQRGHGIGSLFSGLFRTIFPIFKKLAPVIGRKALSFADDMTQGKSFKEAAKSRLFEGINEGINTFAGSNNAQSGSGITRTRRRQRKKPKSRKRKHSIDIFS
jgi:hypothetical protein